MAEMLEVEEGSEHWSAARRPVELGEALPANGDEVAGMTLAALAREVRIVDVGGVGGAEVVVAQPGRHLMPAACERLELGERQLIADVALGVQIGGLARITGPPVPDALVAER